MWLKFFFKPSIESDNPKKRLLALKKISDSNILLQVALKDSSKEVSLKASQLLHSKKDLQTVLRDSKHLKVRIDIVKRLGKGHDIYYLDLLKGALPVTLKKQILLHIEDKKNIYEAETIMKEGQFVELKRKLSLGQAVDESVLQAYLFDSRLEEKDLTFLKGFKEKWSKEHFKLGKLLIDRVSNEKDIDLILSSLNPAYKAHNRLFRLGLEKLIDPFLLGKHSCLYLYVMGDQDRKFLESLTKKIKTLHINELKEFFNQKRAFKGLREEILFKEDIFLCLMKERPSKELKALIEHDLREEYKRNLLVRLEGDGKIKVKDCLLWVKKEGGENYVLREKAWQYLGAKGIQEYKLKTAFREFVQENYGRSVSFATHFDSMIEELSLAIKKSREYSKRKCSYCSGNGFIYDNSDVGRGKKRCFHCLGKGYLETGETSYILEEKKL